MAETTNQPQMQVNQKTPKCWHAIFDPEPERRPVNDRHWRPLARRGIVLMVSRMEPFDGYFRIPSLMPLIGPTDSSRSSTVTVFFSRETGVS